MTKRLSTATLEGLPAHVKVPGYDRSQIERGIVHLGVGAFHRAHQAVYVDDILETDPRWGIVGASLRRPDTRDALKPQDSLYTLVSRAGKGDEFRVVGSLLDVLQAEDDRAALFDALTDENTRIVSLTITEKGYCHDPATGELDADHPDIVHDLAHPDAPRSAPGLLVQALAERRSRGFAAFTVVSCDNLPSNGDTARRIVVGFAQRLDPIIGNWIRNETAFPSTMVDRIVPATTDADREEVAKVLGVADAWPVMTEPFSQWVIEDDFPAGRPDFGAAGAQMVADVAPFELMKLRMLNGSHSTLAYLGYLAGFETVADAIADDDIEALIKRLMHEEAIPTLDVPGVDLSDYALALIERFANPALHHRTWQIAMDGSQKLPQRLLGTIRDRIAARAPYPCLALGVAAWMRYVTGVGEHGAKIDVQDPLADRLAEIGAAHRDDPQAMAAAYLGVAEVFGSDLAANPEFVAIIGDHLTRLIEEGAHAAVRHVLVME